MNDFALLARWMVEGKLWEHSQLFMPFHGCDRRWLHAMRREFDRRLAAHLVEGGNLYRIERIWPRQAMLLDRGLRLAGDYRDDGDWLDEALFPPSDMEVFAQAFSGSMADVNRRNGRENTRVPE